MTRLSNGKYLPQDEQPEEPQQLTFSKSILPPQQLTESKLPASRKPLTLSKLLSKTRRHPVSTYRNNFFDAIHGIVPDWHTVSDEIENFGQLDNHPRYIPIWYLQEKLVTLRVEGLKQVFGGTILVVTPQRGVATLVDDVEGYIITGFRTGAYASELFRRMQTMCPIDNVVVIRTSGNGDTFRYKLAVKRGR